MTQSKSTLFAYWSSPGAQRGLAARRTRCLPARAVLPMSSVGWRLQITDGCLVFPGRWGRRRPDLKTFEGSVMNAFTIAALSAAEFEIARGVIPELSGCASYDDWLDRRYGRFIGLSTGGAHAELVMVSLGDFLDWCGDHEIPANEAALDAFAALRLRRPIDAATATQAGLGSPAAETAVRVARAASEGRSSARSRVPNSAARSAAVDL